jgi:fatty acid desaturase
MVLKTIAAYAKELKPALSKRAFEPARSRLLWMPVHLAVIVALTTLTAWGIQGHWWIALLTVPVLGFSFAGLTFLAHEALHGAVVRNKPLRHVVGFIGFLAFVVSPRLWIRWHNQVHHAHAQEPGADPDAFPLLDSYNQNGKERLVIDYFSVGRRRLRGVMTLLLGFTFHSVHMLLSAKRRGLLSPAEHRWAVLETLIGMAIWISVGVWVGPAAFVVVYVLPLMIANSIVMAYILTNHSLSPLTAVNDPLVNSLSVTVPRFVDWLTMHFGFHVEHHIFPWMSTRHAKEVRTLIRQRWPERYQSMPLHKALAALFRTARVYKDETTLIDPQTGKQWPTLQPTPAPARPVTAIKSVPPPRAA